MSAVSFSKVTKFVGISVLGVPSSYQVGLYAFLNNIPGKDRGHAAATSVHMRYDLSKISEGKLLNSVRHGLSEHRQTEGQLMYHPEWVFWAMIDAPRPDRATRQRVLYFLQGRDFISEAGWTSPSFHSNAIRLSLIRDPDEFCRSLITATLTKHLNL